MGENPTPGPVLEPAPELSPESASAATASEVGGFSSRWVAMGTLAATIVLSVAIALNPGWVHRLGQWGYAGAFVISLVASASIILPVPGLPIAMGMGVALNPLLLGIVTGVGSAIGEFSGYVAGASGRALVPESQSMRYERLERWTEKYGPLAIFLVAVAPVPIFDLAGIAAGAIRMPMWQFFVAAALGKTVKYTIAILLAAGSFRGIEQWIH